MIFRHRDLFDKEDSTATLHLKAINHRKRTRILFYVQRTSPNAFYNTMISPPVFRLLLKNSVGTPLMAAPKSCPECSKMMMFLDTTLCLADKNQGASIDTTQ